MAARIGISITPSAISTIRGVERPPPFSADVARGIALSASPGWPVAWGLGWAALAAAPPEVLPQSVAMSLPEAGGPVLGVGVAAGATPAGQGATAGFD